MSTNPKPNLLCIDDEERILRSLKMLFRRTHNVYTTTSPKEYEQLLKKHHMHVVISDQQMPECTGTEILRKTRKLSPNSMRILLTGYADLSAVIDSINEGEIFRYLTKPWDIQEIKIIVQKATEIAQELELKANEKKPVTDKREEIKSDIAPVKTRQKIKKIKHRPRILFIDANKSSRKKFKEKFSEDYDIHCATTLEEVEKLLVSYRFMVALTDIEFNGEDITPLIYTLKKIQPSLVTIVITNFTDTKTLINLINKGQVYRCLPRPVGGKILKKSLERAVTKFKEMEQNNIEAKRYQVEETTTSTKQKSKIPKVSKIIGKLHKAIKLKKLKI